MTFKTQLIILSLLLYFISACSSVSNKIFPPWSELDLPVENLKVISKNSDRHSFYAEYANYPEADLKAEISRRITTKGYLPTCSLFNGLIQGFTKGEHQIIMRIDSFGPTQKTYLAIFDEKGKEPLLHGSCFGRYELREEQ